MKNLYEELEVAETATKDEIKKAYRKKAKKSHPDAGGDRNDFDKINKAYMILHDDVKRSKYDETGDEDTIKKPVRSLALEMISSILSQMIDQDAPLEIDFISVIRENLKKIRNENQNKIENCNKGIKKIERIVKKLKKKKGEALLERMLEEKTRTLKRQRENTLNYLNAAKEAITIINNYEFEPEGTGWIRMRIMGANTTGTTTY